MVGQGHISTVNKHQFRDGLCDMPGHPRERPAASSLGQPAQRVLPRVRKSPIKRAGEVKARRDHRRIDFDRQRRTQRIRNHLSHADRQGSGRRALGAGCRETRFVEDPVLLAAELHATSPAHTRGLSRQFVEAATISLFEVDALVDAGMSRRSSSA